MNRLIIISTLIFTITSCTYDNEEEYYDNTCDTLNVTYSQTIKPIMDASCVSCHNSGFASGGVILESYADVKQSADNGFLIGVIDHEPGFEAMPPAPAPKLDDCTIEKVKKWIAEGAQNN